MMGLYYAALGLLFPLCFLQVYHLYIGSYALFAVDTFGVAALVACIVAMDRRDNAE